MIPNKIIVVNELVKTFKEVRAVDGRGAGDHPI